MTEHEDEHGQRGFRVVDKRRFTTEGEARDNDHSSDEQHAIAPAPVSAQPVAAPARQPQHAPQVSAQQTSAESPPEDAEPETSVDLLSFVASLATNALAAMGAIPEARAQGIPQDLGMAQEYIEILIMLRHKTRGNLSKDEEQAFDRILGDLRVQFVKIAGL